MGFLKTVTLFSMLGLSAFGTETIYNCHLKIHCSQLEEDKNVSFQYVAELGKKEPKTVDLGIVRGRVYGPHYLSLYLFDTRHPNTNWAKTHSNSLVNDLEISLVIPENNNHTMVANLRCDKAN